MEDSYQNCQITENSYNQRRQTKLLHLVVKEYRCTFRVDLLLRSHSLLPNLFWTYLQRRFYLWDFFSRYHQRCIFMDLEKIMKKYSWSVSCWLCFNWQDRQKPVICDSYPIKMAALNGSLMTQLRNEDMNIKSTTSFLWWAQILLHRETEIFRTCIVCDTGTLSTTIATL